MNRPPLRTSSRPRLQQLLLALLHVLLAACSVLDPAFTADRPGASGRRPVAVDVEITGNEGLAAAELRKQIEDFMLDLSRDPTREAAAYDAALELEDFYRTQGYPVAKVGYEYSSPGEAEPWPDRVRVRFLVKEGPLVTVRMTLSGNVAHDDEQLLALWQRRRYGAFGTGAPVFVEAQVRAFVEDLRTFYRAQGRLDADVRGPRIELDLEQRVAKVAIELQEGQVHTIRAVDVAAPLRAALGADLPALPEGRPCSQVELRTFRQALRTALRRLGHANPQVELTTEPIEGVASAMRLRVEGDPGPVASVTTVAVAGNERTLDGVILGRLGLRSGDRYDGTKIDEALRRLYATGLFRKVEILETPADGDPERLALLIKVEEADSRSIEFMVGYGSYEQLRGGLRLEERNLFGTGLGIALDNKISMKGWSTGLTLTDPDFMATDATLTVSGEYFRREEPSFTDKAAGGTIALARPIAATLTARVGYTYRNRTDPLAFTTLPQDQLVDFIEGKVFVELRNDRRDNLLFPKTGHVEFLSFERIAPAFGADVDLDRLTFRAAQHIPLFDPLRLVLRSEQNVLWPHEGSAGVPLQERWFNGGESTVRSFHESELGPKDVDGNPIGGEYRNVFGAELRFPITETLEAGLFADAGNVGSNVQDFSLRDLGFALGVGVRLLLPIGPVRLDSAWNPDPDPGDDRWVLHLSVGYPF